MREILFRGKSKFDKDNKWVYGDLLQGENSYISTKEEFYSAVVGLDGHLSTCIELVDKETIGQYTGLCDKNGTKIFEGDIVKDILGHVGQIVYKEKHSAFVVDEWWCGYALWFEKEIEVIGNIFDNGDLTIEN